MSLSMQKKREGLAKRQNRLRKKISGTGERPRLSVYRSLHHIYAQIIDDEKGVTLASASTMEKEFEGKLKNGDNVKAAEAVGELVAKRGLERKISAVVFDRGGRRYHGRIKALADAARKAGLKF